VMHTIKDSFGFSIVADTGHKIVYSGDTSPCEHLIEHARGANILFHEATFTSDYAKNLYGHSTVKDAIRVGVDAQVYRVVLMHISLRYHKEMHKYYNDINFNTIPIEIGEDLKEYST